MTAYSVPRAIVGACPLLAPSPLEASIAYTNAIVGAFAIARATKMAHAHITCRPVKARHAGALVVLAHSCRSRAVPRAVLDAAVRLTVSRLAEANALFTPAMPRAIGRASGLAVVVDKAVLARANAINTFSVIVAIIWANLDRAVTAIKPLVARAGSVCAHATERAVVCTGNQRAITAGEARATQTLPFLRAHAVARAAVRASRRRAILARKTRETGALEGRTAFSGRIADTVAGAGVGTLLDGTVRAAESRLALARPRDTLASERA